MNCHGHVIVRVAGVGRGKVRQSGSLPEGIGQAAESMQQLICYANY